MRSACFSSWRSSYPSATLRSNGSSAIGTALCGTRCGTSQMGENRSDVLQGTLDLMVLKTLESMGPIHGYGIARRIEQVSDNAVSLNQGTIYPALLRLLQRKWISAEWGTSETGRSAKFYSLSRIGRKQIEMKTQDWERTAAIMARFLSPSN
jgi:PadR family transcriptional regulator PadR